MRGATRGNAQSVSEHAHIVRWPWHDPWGGQFMTHTRAAMESDHARQMFAAAMRGTLHQSYPPLTVSEPPCH